MSAATEIRRRISLPEGVRVRFWMYTDFPNSLHVQYLGTTEALLAAACLTRSMVAIRAARRSKVSPLRDEHNEKFHLSRSPSRGAPDRMLLTRFVSAKTAMQLPGVREMFPEGLPAPEVHSEQFDRHPVPGSAQEWKTEQTEGLRVWFDALPRVAGINTDDPRFQFDGSDLERLETLIGSFHTAISYALYQAAVVDKQSPGRRGPPSFLRLVVDNSRAGVSLG
jgi:hypothetical protein